VFSLPPSCRHTLADETKRIECMIRFVLMDNKPENSEAFDWHYHDWSMHARNGKESAAYR
jgi:hypothetical protein